MSRGAEPKWLRGRTRRFEIQVDGLSNALRDLVQGSRLGVASGKLWDRSDVVALFIPFNDNIELARHFGNPRCLS